MTPLQNVVIVPFAYLIQAAQVGFAAHEPGQFTVAPIHSLHDGLKELQSASTRQECGVRSAIQVRVGGHYIKS